MAVEVVSIPQDHAGVGAALRAAFLPHTPDLSNELVALLERLS